MMPRQGMALGEPAVSLNGTAPRCEHLDGLAPVTPLSNDCRDRPARRAGLTPRRRSAPAPAARPTGTPAGGEVLAAVGWVGCLARRETGRARQ
jgi:hypothetical protein